MTKKALLLFSFVGALFLGMNSLSAEPPSFMATVDKTSSGVGEPIVLILTFSGVQSAPAPDVALDGFSVNYIGPFTQLSVFNGATSSLVSHRYRLIPQKTGTFTIGPFSANVAGQTLKTDAITINVSEQKTPSTPGSPASQDQNLNPSQLTDRAYTIMELDRKTAYINEKLSLKIRLLINHLSIKDVHFPTLAGQGFTLGDFGQPRQYQAAVNGIAYDVLEFNTSLFATRLGEFNIGPATIVCTLLVPNQQAGALPPEMQGLLNGNFFGNFFGYETRPLECQSMPFAITVLPLPDDGKPADFSGAVGDFTLDAAARPQKVKLGDPITVTMTIKGDGNFVTVTKPHLNSENDFKIYEPVIKQEGTSKIFEQVISPESKSLTEIPQVRFSFFNPVTGQYQTRTAGPWPLEVTELAPAAAQGTTLGENAVTAVPEEKLGSDIFYIKESTSLKTKESAFLYQRPSFWVSVAFPLPLLWAFLLWIQERNKLRGDSRYARRLLAPRKAKNSLRLARQLMKAEKTIEFYTVVSKTAREYFGDRFHMASAAITLDTVLSHLAGKPVSGEILEMTSRVFKDCDAARYAPSTAQKEQTQRTLTDIETLIDYFEKTHAAA